MGTVSDLFVYGELCKPPVLRQLLGRVPSAEPAVLAGFSRRLVQETGYFCAVAQADAVIVGLLLGDIEPVELARLDSFENVEGGEYRRIGVRVRTVASGRERPAQVYVGA
jgi:gamma-glutamylcyclotransferase (GGCT)/AIG2-like uncharacterized protein YtfP